MKVVKGSVGILSLTLHRLSAGLFVVSSFVCPHKQTNTPTEWLTDFMVMIRQDVLLP